MRIRIQVNKKHQIDFKTSLGSKKKSNLYLNLEILKNIISYEKKIVGYTLLFPSFYTFGSGSMDRKVGESSLITIIMQNVGNFLRSQVKYAILQRILT